MNAIVVIPTFNERGNIVRLLGRLLRIKAQVSILVVDDNSPDGTADVVRRFQRRFPNRVHLLERPGKRGLGSAYADGFAKALELGPFECFVQMDADLSHPPELVGNLIEQAEAADVAIGSRYVRGGSTPGWSPSRWVLSRSSAWFVRMRLGLDLSDPLGGFKCFTRRALERIDFASVRSRGFAFQLEVNWICLQLGLTVAEVPIRFDPRHAGRSKMSLSIVWEALSLVRELEHAAAPALRSRPMAPVALVSTPVAALAGELDVGVGEVQLN